MGARGARASEVGIALDEKGSPPPPPLRYIGPRARDNNARHVLPSPAYICDRTCDRATHTYICTQGMRLVDLARLHTRLRERAPLTLSAWILVHPDGRLHPVPAPSWTTALSAVPLLPFSQAAAVQLCHPAGHGGAAGGVGEPARGRELRLERCPLRPSAARRSRVFSRNSRITGLLMWRSRE